MSFLEHSLNFTTEQPLIDHPPAYLGQADSKKDHENYLMASSTG